MDWESGTVRLPRICFWYLGDFGGLGGLRRLLREVKLIPDDRSPSLRFASYDWRPAPGRFRDGAARGRGEVTGE